MTMAMKNPPRRTTIKGQKHLLAYITPEEAQLLMDNGGSGEPGPMGIPAFPPGFGSESSGFGAERAGGAAGGKSGAAGPSGDGPDKDNDKGMSPGEAKARFGSGGEKYSGMTKSEIAAKAGALSASASKAQQAEAQKIAKALPQAQSYIENVNSLQNLNRQLEDLSRREAVAQSRLRSPLSLIPGVGLANYLGLQNVRNLAAAAIGAPPGLLGSFGLGERVSPDFGGLGVNDLVGLQSQAITDDMGNIVGFRDEAGNVRYGTDPDAMGTEGDGRDVVPTQTNPVTGQEECPEGYVFDEDLQACRMGGDLPMDYTGRPGVGAATGDLYGRMGLLDVAPTGLGMFKQRFGAGFGSPSEFDTANMAFRRSGGVQRPYQGYTLLS